MCRFKILAMIIASILNLHMPFSVCLNFKILNLKLESKGREGGYDT